MYIGSSSIPAIEADDADEEEEEADEDPATEFGTVKCCSLLTRDTKI